MHDTQRKWIVIALVWGSWRLFNRNAHSSRYAYCMTSWWYMTWNATLLMMYCQKVHARILLINAQYVRADKFIYFQKGGFVDVVYIQIYWTENISYITGTLLCCNLNYICLFCMRALSINICSYLGNVKMFWVRGVTGRYMLLIMNNFC